MVRHIGVALMLVTASTALSASDGPPAHEQDWLITPSSIGFADGRRPVRELRRFYPNAEFGLRRAAARTSSMLLGSVAFAAREGPDELFVMDCRCRMGPQGEFLPRAQLTAPKTPEDVHAVIYTSSPRFATPEGVRVGNTLAQVAKLYGKPVAVREWERMSDSSGKAFIYSERLGGYLDVFREAVVFPFATPPAGRLGDQRDADYGNYMFIAEPSASREHVGKWPANRRISKEVSYEVDLNARITAIAPGRLLNNDGPARACVDRLRRDHARRLRESGKPVAVGDYRKLCPFL